MFDWLKGFTDVLDLEPPKAWVATLIGATALVFIRYNWWPLGTGEVITAPVAGFLTLYGASNLIVRFVRWFMKRRETDLEIWKNAQRYVHDAEQHAKEVEANLTALTPLEFVQLLWILRRGQQRVDQVGLQYGLISKRIVRPVTPHSTHHVEVDDYVWDKREGYLEAAERTGLPSPVPFPVSIPDALKPRWIDVQGKVDQLLLERKAGRSAS